MRYRDSQLYGKYFHLNGQTMFGYVSSVVVGWGTLVPRTRILQDRPFYYRFSGRRKPWVKKVFKDIDKEY